jgi:hypothetical protein
MSAATASVSSAVSATAFVSASTTASIKLLTGDLITIEVCEGESYHSMYRQIQEALPEEICPLSRNQMNLLLEGELVPMTNEPAVVFPEYLLVLDDVFYRLYISQCSYEGIDMADADRPTYLVLDVELKRYVTHNHSIGSDFCQVLFDNQTKTYRDLEGVEQSRDDERSRYADLCVFLPEGSALTREQMIDVLMRRVDQELSPSLAMLRAMRADLNAELAHEEKNNPSWAEFQAELDEERGVDPL